MFLSEFYTQSPLRTAISEHIRSDETEAVQHLLSALELSDQQRASIAERAESLVAKVREKRKGGLDAFLYQYDLSSEEGITLMCLAEAMLRIPDKTTVDKLISDKIPAADWESHSGKSDSTFVNAATWALMLTGKILEPKLEPTKYFRKILGKLVKKAGEPTIRTALGQAMKILGKQFVMGRSIEEAIKRARSNEKAGYAYSYDMLGEAARTMADAERYFTAYANAITAIGKAAKGTGPKDNPGISIKLSALHPRYEFAQRERVLTEMVPKVIALVAKAKAVNIGVTIDAEEAARLDLSLDVIEAVYSDPSLSGWEGFGIALQAYQKRAYYVIDWLVDLVKQHGRRMMVRLVKGAYWDSEIKLAQEEGEEAYPVFTRKASTDVSYLACARKILENRDYIYPQFASHNAHSVSTILEFAGDYRDFEFQCLHGMGQTLYDEIVGENNWHIPCRIYAPVGSHDDLLAYLVRRLLENGANTSFVNRIIDEKLPIKEIIGDPQAELKALSEIPHPKIPLPIDMYGKGRKNSLGFDVNDLTTLNNLSAEMVEALEREFMSVPLLDGEFELSGECLPVFNPATGEGIGKVIHTNKEEIEQALVFATEAKDAWDKTPVKKRADALNKMADLLEEQRALFMGLLIKEAGKTLPDALAELREAVDFCRYYAMHAKKHLKPQTMPGPTGESNVLSMHGRGVILCISPWNFPLAIFLGQIAAALVAGNAVIAKPAEQTPLIALLAVQLFHDAGIPDPVLQLLPGTGQEVGKRLVEDARIDGVMFTGSTETAKLIQRDLAAREGAIVPLIAETGGLNTMLVDSSALPEQVVADVVRSAFGSAGQRCSALRVLFVQDDVADKVITMLKGAMEELTLGDPSLLATDVGPVIDADAENMLKDHLARMQKEAKLIYQLAMPEGLQGHYFAPVAFEINSISQLPREVFGPFLHVIRYQASELDKVLESIQQTGYGLTLGIHSRIQTTIDKIQKTLAIGNTYVNRNMIGAVVGVQPFGGEGLSGTGPKAGGPHYLYRLVTERTVTVDTTAAGGNAHLMSL